MSLTSDLKDKQSKVSRFLRQEFPQVRHVMKLSRDRMKEANVSSIEPEGSVPWSIIGQAIDYRLRFYYPQEGGSARVENLVAYDGAERACGPGMTFGGIDLTKAEPVVPGFLNSKVALAFFNQLEAFLAAAVPTGRRLEAENENHLLRFCVVLAAFDVFVRRGVHQSILLTPKPRASVEELLAIAEQNWIDDLRRLSWGFYDKYHEMLKEPAVLNPHFLGRVWVGGADADLIVGKCLVDIKTTKCPLKESDWIYQLLGYALLDWNNQYNIQEVAVFFSRQQFFLRWSLDDLMAQLTDGEPPNIKDVRQRWRDALTGGRRNEKQIDAVEDSVDDE